MQLRIQADFAPIAARLNRLSVQLGNLRPVMGGIGGILAESTAARIRESKTAPDGSPWAEWTERTRAMRTRKDGTVSGSLLLQSGMQGGLLRTITYEASQDSVVVGSGKHYAAYLQQGTRRMVARPFLGLSAQDYRDIDELLADFLSGAIGGTA
ncbi:phage virion morphogenesis protein [Conchiformibius steedae]|uniref:phage virion morphogenesis protein n=1 Tax=Conchiformibius steedae TaxID=153493 RepID=UPI0026F2A5BC|nr:phage virion morphogenesis protein [Conchiformibius steedae]